MSSIALGRADVIIGVDTHKDEHVAVAIDGLGRRLGDFSLATNPNGYAQLVAWAVELGVVSQFGVEGTGSYGSGLARYLRRNGYKVVEVTRPPPQGRTEKVGQERRDRCRARCSRGSRRQGDRDSEAGRWADRSHQIVQNRP